MNREFFEGFSVVEHFSHKAYTLLYCGVAFGLLFAGIILILGLPAPLIGLLMVLFYSAGVYGVKEGQKEMQERILNLIKVRITDYSHKAKLDMVFPGWWKPYIEEELEWRGGWQYYDIHTVTFGGEEFIIFEVESDDKPKRGR